MTVIYEDAVVRASVVSKGATVGHIVVEPLQDAQYLFDLPDEVAAQLFYCASFAATAVFESLGAQGTNIVLNEGEGPLQLHVLPRGFEDGLKLSWDPVRADPAALDSMQKKMSDNLWYVGKEAEQNPSPVVDEPIDFGDSPSNPQLHRHRSDSPPEDSYKLKQLRRRL